MAHRILVVEDEEDMQFTLKEALGRRGYEVEVAGDAPRGLEKLKRSSFELVLLDVKLPGTLDGISALPKIREADPMVVVIVMTAFGSRRLAMDALKAGAYDYFTKPFRMEEMYVVIERALEKRQLQKDLRELERRLSQQYDFKNIIGNSDSMREVFGVIQKITDTDVTVLICGESGTGKELIAEAVHYHSTRKDKPFVKLNCVAIPDGLLESELFGHEKGSFTGAIERRIGKFELANKGTIFLDEIGDMSLTTQAKILRVLQEREFERVGGAQTIGINTRVIAATNRDLLKAVDERKFREDLYFRLNVVTIYVPPLRERREDIPLLVEHFIRTASASFRRNVGSISTEALAFLMNYSWPGNVRELQNYIERAIVLSDESVIRPSCLPPQVTRREEPETEVATTGGSRSLKDVMGDLEMQIVKDALSKTGGVQVRAADILGITERSLWHLVKKHSIDVDQFR